MKQQSKFTSLHKPETTVQSQSDARPGHEFASVDEMLRHDAARNPVPPGLTGRLQRSLDDEPKPAPSWWQRLLRRKD